jgi:hypothetical protein
MYILIFTSSPVLEGEESIFDPSLSIDAALIDMDREAGSASRRSRIALL